MGLEFCLIYSLVSSSTLCILPWSLLLLSWHLYLASRRADTRALNVPKHAMSIFLMMIPLATAWFDSLSPVQALQSSQFHTAEQKRRNCKSVKLREGPRPRQSATLATMWTFSLLIALERILMTRTDREDITREYTVKTSDGSAEEIQ